MLTFFRDWNSIPCISIFQLLHFFFFRKNMYLCICSTLQMFIGIAKVLNLTSCGQRFTNTVKSTKLKLLQIERRMKTNSLELDLLIKTLDENSNIRPENCFTLNYSSQVTGFTALLTFAIVLFQFRANDIEPNIFCNAEMAQKRMNFTNVSFR